MQLQVSHFNSRPHKEVDLLGVENDKQVENFNSRPHKEVDRRNPNRQQVPAKFQFTTSQGGRLGELQDAADAANISIHDLTRRSTCGSCDIADCVNISIHDLTRRSTAAFSACRPPAAFQLTTSQGGRPGGMI